MKELMPNDNTLTSSSTDGSILWSENDAYAAVMGRSEHSGRVRGVPGALPRRFSRCSTMPSPASQVAGLLDEIGELKDLLEAQHRRLQAHAAQHESQQELIQTQAEQFEAQQQLIRKHAENYEAQQEVIRKQQQDMLQMQKMLQLVMDKTGTGSQFSMPDTEYPPIQVNAKSSVASHTGNILTFTIMR
jgi:hypothetical protein